MSAFKYKLENVLNVREKLEGIKQKEYAHSLAVLEHEKKIKRQIAKSLDKSTLIRKDSISDVIDPRMIKMQQNYHTLLKVQEDLAVKNVAVAKKKTNKQRNELLNAMKDKKTLEVLKEKKFEEFIAEEKKQEQQIIDEIVSFAYKHSK